MVIIVSFFRVAILESSETRCDLPRPDTLRLITLLSETTSGLAFKLCGAIGVITRLFEFGSNTGPQQLNEYPVEPVGVDMMRPSDQ